MPKIPELRSRNIGDPGLPGFVEGKTARTSGSPEARSIEIQMREVNTLEVDAGDLIRNLQSLDCRTIFGRPGREPVSVEVLKIDRPLVFNCLRSEASAARTPGIVSLVHAVGINTMAEWVESSGAVVKPRNLGVDYAPGVAIAPVLPLHTFN